MAKFISGVTSLPSTTCEIHSYIRAGANLIFFMIFHLFPSFSPLLSFYCILLPQSIFNCSPFSSRPSLHSPNSRVCSPFCSGLCFFLIPSGSLSLPLFILIPHPLNPVLLPNYFLYSFILPFAFSPTYSLTLPFLTILPFFLSSPPPPLYLLCLGAGGTVSQISWNLTQLCTYSTAFYKMVKQWGKENRD